MVHWKRKLKARWQPPGSSTYKKRLIFIQHIYTESRLQFLVMTNLLLLFYSVYFSRFDNCEVCGIKAQYTCPKCEVRTCSLTCVNIHKKELECDGIRDKTKFIPLTSFTDLDLLSGNRQSSFSI